MTGLEPGLTVPNIHPARPGDLDHFRSMERDYLTELRLHGSEIQPTERSVGFYCDLFDAFVVHRSIDGVVVISDIGFSMAGNATSGLDTDFGKTAIGWGTYVAPHGRGFGHANELRKALRIELRRLGFQTVTGGVHPGNAPAIDSLHHTGWTQCQLYGYDDLRRGD